MNRKEFLKTGPLTAAAKGAAQAQWDATSYTEGSKFK